jgi:hypothetical protein
MTSTTQSHGRRTRIRREVRLRVRATSMLRLRGAELSPVPIEIVLSSDGSAIVSYRPGEPFVRYDTLADCLEAHGLRATDIESVPSSAKHVPSKKRRADHLAERLELGARHVAREAGDEALFGLGLEHQVVERAVEGELALVDDDHARAERGDERSVH